MSEPAGYTWTSALLSNVGNVRKVNEDAGVEMPENGIWVIADGMGGHAAGDVASSMIVDSLKDVGSHERPSGLVDEIEDRLLAVNRELFRIASEAAQPVTIGSTVVVLLAFVRWALCVWAGDSRVYRLRNGKLKQITRDHSQVEEMIDQGEILREDAEDHPLANVITRAVGGAEELFLDLELVELHHGDRYMLCSDGLYKDLRDGEIGDILKNGNAETTCAELIDTVLEREASDNITVAVVDFRVVDD